MYRLNSKEANTKQFVDINLCLYRFVVRFFFLSEAYSWKIVVLMSQIVHSLPRGHNKF